ncbi:MAG: MBL fold metallo-hydrolase [Gemmatimonadaceae bacterium]
MEIEFSGAAREVTGSCHIVRANGRTVLLDCGMFQGRRREAAEKNKRLPLPVDQIDAVVLSHAHIDHAGRLPFLVREGYQGPIYATPATRDLCAIMLADSANIQERDAEFLARRNKEPVEPLYALKDAVRAVELMRSIPYDTTFDVVPGFKATYTDAGHILGSASVALDVTEEKRTARLVFSGDVGRSGLPIIRDPRPPREADAIICESTYGDRDHESVANARDHLARVVRETAARGGRVLVPAFAVGRAQELIYDLHELHLAGQIPSIPIYVDSPLAISATGIFAAHPEVFDRAEELILKVPEIFEFPLVHYTRDASESKALNTQVGPMVIIAASGMAESGRIVHHLAHGAGDSRNTVLIVGFQAEHTLGRRIVERRPTIKVFGEEIPLRASVEVLNGYSAHADRTELARWLDAVRKTSPRLGSVHLVHGEPGPQDAFAERLRGSGYAVDCPTPGQKVTV